MKTNYEITFRTTNKKVNLIYNIEGSRFFVKNDHQTRNINTSTTKP